MSRSPRAGAFGGASRPIRSRSLPAANQAAVRSYFNYQADVISGMGDIAAAELERLCPGAVIERPLAPDHILFRWTGAPEAVLGLTLATAVWLVLDYKVPRPKALLGHAQFQELARCAQTVVALFPQRTFSTLHVAAAGSESEVMTRLLNQLAAATGLAPDSDQGDLVIRVRRGPTDADSGERGWQALVRLGPRPLSTRPWRVCNLAGALNATVARAMAVLVNVADGDRLLNIACGSATLMVESALAARLDVCAGVDIDAQHIRCGRANLSAAGIGHSTLIHADAAGLPFATASFDKLVADLPFGKLIGTHRQNKALYPAVMAEAARVARPGASMAVITHELRLFETALIQAGRWWQPVRTIPIRLGAMSPRVYLINRTNSRW